ncbi:tannase and feruloyl esterase [Penicillium canescens]|nr:tannase and feruloyl esterase [Penicillium canescens]
MFDILAAEVIKQRDPQNDLSEDIISDPRGCNFNANTLACNMPSAAEKCITADQLSTLHKQDRCEPDICLWPFYWYVRDLMGLEDSFTLQDLDYSTVQLTDKLNPGNATADPFDISDFHKRGGKFLQYHGLSNAYVPPDVSIYYYDQASSTIEPQGIEMNDFYCLFLLPEME